MDTVFGDELTPEELKTKRPDQVEALDLSSNVGCTGTKRRRINGLDSFVNLR